MINFEDLQDADLIPGELYKAGSTNNYFADEVLSQIFKFNNYKGLGTQGGIRRAMIQGNKALKNEEAFIVLVDSKSDEDWINHYDSETRILTYYGDNKNPDKHHLDTKLVGNKTFQKYFHRSYQNKNLLISPFFFFERVNTKDVRFVGIAAPFVENQSLEKTLTLDNFTNKAGEVYKNYRSQFTIIEATVPRQWLLDLKKGRILSEYIPTAWLNFLNSRSLSLVKEEVANKHALSPSPPIDNVGYRVAAYRKTQTYFRKELLKRNNSCQLCHLSIQPLMVASHIIPWAVAREEDRANPENGLLLCILHDALFDKGLISFNDEGKILISNELEADIYEMLNIHGDMYIHLATEQKRFIRIHRETNKL